ncbi:MAG TPA: hypothetical protein VFK33_06965 [Bacillales bacterium]|nr:hypothetical protein [Bacillales bacterium]
MNFDNAWPACYAVKEFNILEKAEAPASHLIDADVQSAGSGRMTEIQCGCGMRRRFFYFSFHSLVMGIDTEMELSGKFNGGG